MLNIEHSQIMLSIRGCQRLACGRIDVCQHHTFTCMAAVGGESRARLRPAAALFIDRARYRRHGADARRREHLRRRLPSGGGRQISGAAGVRDLQQGFPGSRHGGGAAAAAGVVAALDRAAGGGRHEVLRVARLCSRHRLAARRRKIAGRRLARVGLLRPDRMDRRAAVVRRQCRHGRHFRVRRGAAGGRQEAAAASEGDLPVRFARRLWRARRLPRRVSRRRAALFRYLVGHFSAMHQHKGAAGRTAAPSGRSCGATR